MYLNVEQNRGRVEALRSIFIHFDEAAYFFNDVLMVLPYL